MHEDERDLVHAVVQHAIDPAGDGVYETEFRVLHPRGEIRWIFVKGKAFFEDHGGRAVATRFIGTALDRTERKRSHEALIEAERFAVTGRLAASIAHEIRNPIDAVMNLLYLLEGEPSERARAEYILLAREELARVSDIATNTLRFYRDPAFVRDFDVGELTRSVLRLFHGRIALQRVQVEADLPSGLLVSAPEGELRQVCINLIDNALDAMAQGGRLVLRLREIYDYGTRQLRVRLTIADTGQGMPPGVLERIFEAFYSTKGDGGNGLGLWLSLEIMNKCGSSIKVKSAQGRGTVFHLSLIGTSVTATRPLPVDDSSSGLVLVEL